MSDFRSDGAAALEWIASYLDNVRDHPVLSTVEPLCTVLLAAVFLNESIAPLQLVGGALILAAVVLLARAR